MEVRYIKLSPKEALFIRKQILYSELDFLHLIKKIKSYVNSREKEFNKKEIIKKDLALIKSKINLIQAGFPRIESKTSQINTPNINPPSISPFIKREQNNLKKELKLSPEGEKMYNQTLRSLVDWPTQFWRSFYNIRELNLTPSNACMFNDALSKILSKSATQGFGPTHYVFKNLVSYFQQVKDASK